MRPRSRPLLGSRARVRNSRAPQNRLRDGSWDHALAERYVAMASAALLQAAEDYTAQCLVIAGVATVEQLPTETGVMAAVAWSQGLGRLLRNFNIAVKGRPHGSLDEEPADVTDCLRRVAERAALYRLGEMR
ncbi:MAG: hypothetical protein DME04_23520 [Candidatus Rokuibacteriota bacterium]|nr:MAG: hypothetical protein DME04_23520 [Candidatus Rokubacteria bacterium]